MPQAALQYLREHPATVTGAEHGPVVAAVGATGGPGAAAKEAAGQPVVQWKWEILRPL